MIFAKAGHDVLDVSFITKLLVEQVFFSENAAYCSSATKTSFKATT
jgi:hypothetical protein